MVEAKPGLSYSTKVLPRHRFANPQVWVGVLISGAPPHLSQLASGGEAPPQQCQWQPPSPSPPA